MLAICVCVRVLQSERKLSRTNFKTTFRTLLPINIEWRTGLENFKVKWMNNGKYDRDRKENTESPKWKKKTPTTIASKCSHNSAKHKHTHKHKQKHQKPFRKRIRKKPAPLNCAEQFICIWWNWVELVVKVAENHLREWKKSSRS